MEDTKKGRPTLYSEDVGLDILARLEMGESLRAICRDENMPSEVSVRRWSLDAKHPFSAQFARAREVGYLRMAEELLEICDDGTNDYVEREGKDGSTYSAVDHEHISRSKLRVDTRKWVLSKMLPKVYGDKTVVEGSSDDGSIKHVVQIVTGVPRPDGN
jgi:hypothetical protein